jgi:CHAT domain-containing protein
LSLQAEFDDGAVREAIELIEPLLEDPAGAPLPGGIFAQRDYYAHTRDTQRWGWVRYTYAEIVLQARALGHDVAVARAIDELRGEAVGFANDFALSGEATAGSELLGDLLARDGQWVAAIDAYWRAPVAFPYHPYTVLGRELALTRSAQLYAKIAYCEARVGLMQEEAVKQELAQWAVLISEQYRTGGLLIDLALNELAMNTQTQPDHAAVASALKDLREAEMRSRLPREVPLRPSESELGRALADARERVEQAAQSAHLDFREVTAVKLPDLERVVVPGVALVVSLSVPFGGAMIAVTADADSQLRYTMRLTNLDGRTLRGLVETYLALLGAMSGDDPAREKELLADLLKGLQRELGDPLSDLLREAKVASGSEVRFIGGGGSDSLPVNALCHRDSTRALIDDFTLTVMPGLAMASRLASLTRTTSGPSTPFLVIAAAEESDAAEGSAPLDFARLEAALVQAHTGARTLIGTRARRRRVLSDLSSARVVHVAGHAKADVAIPWRSKLVLADGDLTAAELIEGAARLDQAVLSGCETGYTEGGRAPQERAGLTGALLAARCSTVVSTWWPMYDLPSCIVGAETYRLIREDHMTMAVALRRVQSWLRMATRDELLLWCDAQKRYLPSGTRAGKDARRILRTARGMLQAQNAESRPFGSVADWAGFYTLDAAHSAS